MSWKDILVFADDSEEGLTRLKLALELARTHGAHLEAHALIAAPPRPYGVGAGVMAEVYREVQDRLEQQGKATIAAFARLAPLGRDFSAYTADVSLSGVRAAAAEAARAADFVVFGQPQSGASGELDEEIMMGALFGGGQPCLMLPRWIEPHAFGQRALIAWKATPQAARALNAALPLLARATEVRLVIVDPADEEADRTVLQRLATHLQRHGVAIAEPVLTRSSYGEVGRALDAQAEEFGADLLVMGAYGHARLGEFVFGGVSRHIIAEGRQAVLFAH